MNPGRAPVVDPAEGSAPGWPLVLYFHHVHPQLRHYTSLTPDAFARGLDTVLRHFAPAEPGVVTGDPPGTPQVLFTFDDGYRDLLTGAVPALAERGIRAVFFVCTHLLGGSGPDPRDDYLDWDDCAALRAGGHLIASHGLTHVPLTGLSPADAAAQVTDSLGTLHDRLGLDRAVYAYPYGIEAPIPERLPGLGPVRAFGSVKAPARPWPAAPRSIRRTYLPTGAEDGWDRLTRSWRTQWEA
jgi:peptidoglycan/xylan/chitin deacetylase (PgdA/CDA1 family)